MPPSTASAGKRSTTRTLVRGLRLLELIGQARDGATLTELAVAAELDKGTVARLLSTIRTAGWAVQSADDRKFRLAGKALSLSHDTSNHADIKLLARSHLMKLRERWNETINLGIIEGHHIVYIEVIHSTATVRVMSWIGQRNVLTSTALGRALLSRIPAGELQQLLSLLPDAPKSAAGKARLIQRIDECRERGYAIDDEENEPEVFCVGAAICDVSGSPVAAFSVSGPAGRMRPHAAEIGISCVAAASAISTSLGAPSGGDQ